jgi:hypothetical protein
VFNIFKKYKRQNNDYIGPAWIIQYNLSDFFSQFFYCYDKIHGISNLREEGFILAHGFRGFSLRLAGPVDLGLRGGRISWQWECIAEEAAYLMACRGRREKEKEREGEKEREERGMNKVDFSQIFPGLDLSDTLPPLGPHLPIMPSYYDSFKE